MTCLSSAVEKSSSHKESTISLLTTTASPTVRRGGPLSHALGSLGVLATDHFVPERLVVILEVLELLQAFVQVHADMRHDVAPCCQGARGLFALQPA